MKYILLLLFLPCVLHAQLFKAGIVTGLNLAQIDGDALAGYDKLGLNIGVMADIYVADSWSVSIEILFAQKGASTGIFTNSLNNDPNTFGNPPYRWRWDYIELPLLIHYNDQNKMNFGVGIAPARLVNALLIENGQKIDGWFEDDALPPRNPPSQWDIGGVADISVDINYFMKINARIVYSLASVRADARSTRRNFTSRNNAASIRLIFLFSALGQKKV